MLPSCQVRKPLAQTTAAVKQRIRRPQKKRIEKLLENLLSNCPDGECSSAEREAGS
jgi:hypothetical protein